FDAENLAVLWSSTGPGDDPLNFAKGSPPMVANGKVYVASISNCISVYGLKKSTPTLQNFALNHQATGSEPCDPSQTPEKAFNGSTEGGRSDKWCSSAASPFLQVDLGGNLMVGRFVLEHAGAGGDDFLLNTRDFNIQVSVDGMHFDTAATVTGNIQSITTHDIQPVNVRYVRLNVLTPAQIPRATANIYEFQVFAPAAPASRDSKLPVTADPPMMPARTAAVTSPPTITAPPDVAAPPADAQTTASGLAMKVLKP